MSEAQNESDSIRQFKLSNGEEIICKVDMKNIVAKEEWIPVEDALTMWLFDDAYEDDLVTRYAFKPWMSLQDDVSVSVTLRSDNIIAYYKPSVAIIGKYLEIIDVAPPEEVKEKKPALKVVPFTRNADTESMD